MFKKQRKSTGVWYLSCTWLNYGQTLALGHIPDYNEV